jgi:hypothetical protein
VRAQLPADLAIDGVDHLAVQLEALDGVGHRPRPVVAPKPVLRAAGDRVESRAVGAEAVDDRRRGGVRLGSGGQLGGTP